MSCLVLYCSTQVWLLLVFIHSSFSAWRGSGVENTCFGSRCVGTTLWELRGNQPPANKMSQLRVWDYDLFSFFAKGSPGNQQIASFSWSFCTLWAPIASLINTKASSPHSTLTLELGLLQPNGWLQLVSLFPKQKCDFIFQRKRGFKGWYLNTPLLPPS